MANENKFWYVALKVSLSKVTEIPITKLHEEDLESIKVLFEKVNGSWESLALGSVPNWDLLRKVCYVFLEERQKQGRRPFDKE